MTKSQAKAKARKYNLDLSPGGFAQQMQIGLQK